MIIVITHVNHCQSYHCATGKWRLWNRYEIANYISVESSFSIVNLTLNSSGRSPVDNHILAISIVKEVKYQYIFCKPSFYTKGWCSDVERHTSLMVKIILFHRSKACSWFYASWSFARITGFSCPMLHGQHALSIKLVWNSSTSDLCVVFLSVWGVSVWHWQQELCWMLSSYMKF